MIRKIALAVIAILLCIGLFVFPWMKAVLTVALAKGIVVLGIMLLLRAGQVSLGHGMFVAVSAYAVAFGNEWLGTNEMLLQIPFAVVVSGVVGLVIGLFVARYRYIFFAMLNLAFSMVFFSFLQKSYRLTGGSDGVSVQTPTIAGLSLEAGTYNWVLFFLALALCVGCVLLAFRFFRSAMGQALSALKTNEVRVAYIGISPWRTMVVIYTLSAMLAGLGGSLLAYTTGHVTPELSYWTRSGEYVFIAILGGTTGILGPFMGAMVFEFIRTYASAWLTNTWQLTLGTILLVIILFAQSGIWGLFAPPPPKAKTPEEKRYDVPAAAGD